MRSRRNQNELFRSLVQAIVLADVDTAIKMLAASPAAAAYQEGIAVELMAKGADVGAQNRRGAGPLHYAADGAPSFHHWNPKAQAAIITYLIHAGPIQMPSTRAALHRCTEPSARDVPEL
jgi:hypothetical protein